jgi:flagellar basal body-associated protein FliL
MSKQSKDVVVIKEAGEGKMKRIALLILILMAILPAMIAVATAMIMMIDVTGVGRK